MDSAQARFESLPEPLRRQYYHSGLVNMHVAAYCRGSITREDMMERLSTILVDQNARITETLLNYMKWFGSPSNIVAPLFP
jgi:hypothetical protein